jgi:hypothetical protein
MIPVGSVAYQGKLWLAPKWETNEAGGWRAPAHIVSLDQERLQDMRGRGAGFDFAFCAMVPKPVLDQLIEGKPVEGWTVVERPPIRLRLQPG